LTKGKGRRKERKDVEVRRRLTTQREVKCLVLDKARAAVRRERRSVGGVARQVDIRAKERRNGVGRAVFVGKKGQYSSTTTLKGL
jgi:hypothetical protein